jgi:hypothetical protein
MNEKTIEVQDIGRLDLIKLDPYRRDTGTAAEVQLYLDPAQRRALLETYSPGQGVPVAEWHGRVCTIPVTSAWGVVDGPRTVVWLRGAEGQTLLTRICDGHSVEWDGSNHVGSLSDDAAAARDDLERELSDCPTLDGDSAGLWGAGDWLGGLGADGVRKEYGITDRTTDEQLGEIARTVEDDAGAEDAVLYGTIQYLTDLRNELTVTVEGR